MTSTDLAPLDSQQTAQHPRTGKGEIRMQLVDLFHECKIDSRNRARQVINRAARDTDGVCLLGHGQVVVAVD